jgi:dihydrofolate reductase
MISAIAAIGKGNRVIGNKGKIPWHISEDFKYFKEKTLGHPMIMGDKTFETFKKPLPGRTHIVISQKEDYKATEGVIVVHNLEDAFKKAKEQEGNDEIFIIGGGYTYKKALPYTDRLYLTLIEGNFEGDAFFPEYEKEFKKKTYSKHSEDGDYKYEFVVLER